jgi:hypothetical protein
LLEVEKRKQWGQVKKSKGEDANRDRSKNRDNLRLRASDVASVEFVQRGSVAATTIALDPFDDAEIAFCARAECLKGLFVGLALVGGKRNFVTVKFEDDSSLLQACFVRVDV